MRRTNVRVEKLLLNWVYVHLVCTGHHATIAYNARDGDQVEQGTYRQEAQGLAAYECAIFSLSGDAGVVGW
jgi:hypothetical protein